MSISLAGRSVKYPRGIMENLLVKVDKFVFLVDFVILDMGVDNRVPLILGRLFLCTAKALIDVFEGKLTLRLGDEIVTFDDMKSVKESSEQSKAVCMIDTFMDDHRDSDPVESDVGEHAPDSGEPSDWALDLEELLNEPDEYGDDVPSDLLDMVAEVEEIIGKTPSVGMVESVEDPIDPGESL
ncbi:hypothetical protein L1987_70965 [Smallanthus sonchifolius]|uniref:Uncharacterized protein n=1 Tax=Smallanthus sonchifolius TaxID=185202 RepID=A0ACB9AQ92_9ASTR|nr:hypothetical protein L1987_70965 [Smallanthus sonchifolius]